MTNASTQIVPDASKVMMGATLAWVAVLIYASSNGADDFHVLARLDF